MSQKHFNVDQFEVMENLIEVSIMKAGVSIPITIPKDKFLFFLLRDGKLDSEMEYELLGENKIPITSTMSQQEYWATAKKDIQQDLYEYIISNPITYRGNVFTNSVMQLNNSFDLFIARKRRPMSLVYLIPVIMLLSSCANYYAGNYNKYHSFRGKKPMPVIVDSLKVK